MLVVERQRMRKREETKQMQREENQTGGEGKSGKGRRLRRLSFAKGEVIPSRRGDTDPGNN